ncbi:MAG: sulfatase-like hydrolase/transferase [Armatimonadota bacterium]
MPDMETGNVVVMFCDQLRRDLLGCYASELVRTPNIDALAADGTVFDQAYTPVGICSPARASLMTGVYPHQHHMFNNSTPGYSYCEHLRPEMVMLPDWLGANTQCQTGYFGKWHIGPAEDLYASSFDVTHKDYGVSEPLLSSSHWHPSGALAEHVQSIADGKAGTLDMPMEEFPDVLAARYTQQFVRQRDETRPFAAFCGFPGPHLSWVVPDEFGIRYDADDIPMWPNRYDSFEGKPLNQKKQRAAHAHPDGLLYAFEDNDTLKEALACCFSYVELIDAMVGEVCDTLKALGVYDDTTVIFTTDHGDMAGSHGFPSKGSYMYNEVYHIPMVVKPAGGSQVKRVDRPVHLMDATATVLHALTGTPQQAMASQELQGQSLLPLTSGLDDWDRQVHYAEYHGDWFGHYSARMVTDGSWKLVWNLTDLCELYHLDEDPAEMDNLFYDPAYRQVRDRMMETLLEEAKRLGDGQMRLYHPHIEEAIEDTP